MKQPQPQLPAKSAINCALVFCFLASFLTFTSAGRAESRPEARVLQAKEPFDIQEAGKSVAERKTVKAGHTIVSGADGMALLALTSGQFLIVDKATKVSVSELKYSLSGPHRSTAVHLENGTLFSQVRQPRQGTTAHKVSTRFGDLSAKGTAWRTTVVGNTLSAVVYGGAVVYAYPGIGDINFSAGTVATMTGAPSKPVLKVIDLLTGRVTIYQPGQQPESRLPEPRELDAGARIFETGINAFRSTATDAAQVAFGQLSSQINQMLASHGVTPISNRGGPLFPRVLTAATTSLADVASPESANPNP